MACFLAVENFRLVDKGEYYSVGQVVELDDGYTNGSRSFAAAMRAGWLRRVSDIEAKELKEKWLASKAKKSEPKVIKQDNKAIIDKQTRSQLQVSDMKDSDIADDVIDPQKIQNIVNKRKEARESAEVAYRQSKEQKTTEPKVAKVATTENKESSGSIKEAIDKKAAEKVKSLKIGKKRKTKG